MAVTPNRSITETHSCRPETNIIPSPISPVPNTSPLPGTPTMAKSTQSAPPDPRKGLGSPVHYHTGNADTPDPLAGLAPLLPPPPVCDPEEPPVTDSSLWKRVKRSLFFWQMPTDVVQVSVFGPETVTPGQPTRVTVYLHTPASANSVQTLSRAFHHDSELIGSGYVSKEVARDTMLGVHLTVANAGVATSLVRVAWRGQPQRLVFDLHVPWEAPSGPAPGVISIGLGTVLIGTAEFYLNLLPRKC